MPTPIASTTAKTEAMSHRYRGDGSRATSPMEAYIAVLGIIPMKEEARKTGKLSPRRFVRIWPAT